jgi:hypothetical protein
MGNHSGNAYALTALCPIREGHIGDLEVSYANQVRALLDAFNDADNSPMAKVPNTYLCRFFVLDDVYTQSLPGASILDTIMDLLPVAPEPIRLRALPKEDHLKSRYLVFSSNFYCGPQGDVDTYLRGMWDAIGSQLDPIWNYCWGYQGGSAEAFITYIKRCQLTASLFFVGANDQPLAEQLKALYVKQEFARFAVDSQGLPTAQLREQYRAMIARIRPADVAGPSWTPGQYRLT